MKTRVLFTGYAPVHFLCFRPLFERLVAHGGFDVHLSGGLRSKGEEGEFDYDERAMYCPFGLSPDVVRPLEEVRQAEYDLLFAANTKMILPASVAKKIQIFHGISFRNKAVREENASADHYFVVGPYMRRKFVERGMFEPDDPRLLSIGFAKTDALLNGTLDRRSLLEQHGLSGDRPVLLYAPTGQRRNSLETMGEEVIRRIIEANRFDLLIKLHDHPKGSKDWPSALAAYEGPHMRLVKELDVVPLLYLADLLITDASSVANEYALLDRPIVFLDVPDLIASAQQEGSAVDLDTWGRKGGLIVEGPETVVEALDQSLGNASEFSEVRRESVHDLFYNPGHATDAAMQWLASEFPAKQAASAPTPRPLAVTPLSGI